MNHKKNQEILGRNELHSRRSGCDPPDNRPMSSRRVSAVRPREVQLAGLYAACGTMRTAVPNEATPCVQVIAFNRPRSLRRLLKQLNRIDYGPSKGRVWLHISIDQNIDNDANRTADAVARVNHTVAIAKAFKFEAGVKTMHVRRRHAGLVQQWHDAWRPDLDKDDAHEACVLLEDDTLPSVYAWRWTMQALHAYRNESHIASFGWQRPTLVAARVGANNGTLGRMPPPRHQPFLYKLMSTWGFVALRRHWTCFLAWSAVLACELGCLRGEFPHL